MENSLKMDNHHGVDGGFSIVIGFFLAIGNQTFGWLNSLLTVHTIHWSVQAIIVGFIGATTTHFTHKLWKFIEKKYLYKFFKNKKHKDENQ